MKPEYDAKLNLTVDVVETKDGYAFTLHHARKATTWQVRALGAGFQRVMEIVDKHNEDLKGT
jgi:hypothetical protein